MSYSNVLNAVNVYGNVLGRDMYSYGNKSNRLGDINDSSIYGRTQPYRGPSTFTSSSSRNIYGNEVPETYDPRSMYQDEKGNWIDADPLVRGSSAIQTALLGKQLSPYASNIISKGYSAITGKDPITDAAGKTVGIGPGLGWGMAVKSYTDDRNPYTYTSREKLGDYAGNVMMASSVAPAVGLTAASAGTTAIAGMHPVALGLALAYSWWKGKKKKKKAKKLIAQAEKQVKDAQLEAYEDRSQQVQDARDKYMADLSHQQWEQGASRYDNQYGGAYNTPYGYSYGEEGMKFSPDELVKLDGGGLYANINKRKKAGTSRSKANSTISPENYKKMKKGFYDGGKINAVAEFTGNELIVNDQTTVEKGLSKNNYSMAAAPIRKAMGKGYVTPGIETHEGNPMPVDDKGNIYAGGGKLPFKVNKGAGVYDHATDQFRPTMTDKEIAMVAQSNINKWESNGMA